MEKTTGGMTKKAVRSVCGLLAAGLLVAAVMPMHAAADEEEAQPQQITEAEAGKVTFSTDYPGVTIKPGGTSTFTLYITNTGSEETTVELGAEDLPEGWEGSFKGSSNEVSMVHVGAYQKKEDSPSLSYSLTVPEDTKEDIYTISLNAKGGDVDESLALTVKVDAEEKKIGAGEFSTDYAQQEGDSGTKFSYTTTLTNNSGENMTYSLSAEGAPEGWTVTFTPSDTTTATSSVPVDAGASSTIKAAIVPAQNVTAGEYPITLVAACAGETLELPVTVKITGTYSLTATTPTGNLSTSAYAGETKDVAFSIQNTGNIDLTAVSLKAQASTDWEITFDQDTINEIPAGGSAEVTAHITPAKDAILGDYVTIITASNDAVSSDCALRISVQNHTSWGIAAVAVIAVLVLGLVLIIRRFGRR
ncbi:MAG: COG1470 family protein [Lachnospiraceae bacterium]